MSDKKPPPSITERILADPGAFLSGRQQDGRPTPPPGSLTSAILDTPAAFLTDPGPGDGNDHGHDNGPDRGR